MSKTFENQLTSHKKDRTDGYVIWIVALKFFGFGLTIVVYGLDPEVALKLQELVVKIQRKTNKFEFKKAESIFTANLNHLKSKIANLVVEGTKILNSIIQKHSLKEYQEFRTTSLESLEGPKTLIS